MHYITASIVTSTSAIGFDGWETSTSYRNTDGLNLTAIWMHPALAVRVPIDILDVSPKFNSTVLKTQVWIILMSSYRILVLFH
jgi:hypothetical protein